MILFVSIVFGFVITICLGLIVWSTIDILEIKAEFDAHPPDQVFMNAYREIRNAK
jgi:hypothetical protein